MLKKIFGDSNESAVKKLRPIIAKINEFEPEFEALSDAALRAKTADFRTRLADG